MAHSSGGGSHGGGTHGGSRGGSHSGSSTSQYRHSHTRFPGSRRYTYTAKDGTRKYVYSRVHPARQGPGPWVQALLFLPILLLMLVDAVNGFFIPRRLPNPCSRILIQDRLNILEDEGGLRHKLEQFYEETGVTPGVVTVGEEDWRDDYYSLEDYALAEYYRLFDDELHWLIVYSAPQDEAGNVIPYRWKFEGIIGDDTGHSVNDKLCESFTNELYDQLMSDQNPGEAIGRAFRSTLHIREHGFFSLNGDIFAMLGVSVLVFAVPVGSVVRSIVDSIKYKNAKLDE